MYARSYMQCVRLCISRQYSVHIFQAHLPPVLHFLPVCLGISGNSIAAASSVCFMKMPHWAQTEQADYVCMCLHTYKYNTTTNRFT